MTPTRRWLMFLGLTAAAAVAGLVLGNVLLGGGAGPANLTVQNTPAPLAPTPPSETAAAGTPSASPASVPTSPSPSPSPARRTSPTAARTTAAPSTTASPKPSPSPTPKRTTPPPPSPTATATTVALTMQDNSFSPTSMTIQVGDTVRATNRGDRAHTWTSTTGLWDSGSLGTGQSYSFKFTSPGSYSYLCSFHSEMTGSILVQ